MLRVLFAELTHFDPDSAELTSAARERFAGTRDRRARIERVGGFTALAGLCESAGIDPGEIYYESGRPSVPGFFAGITHTAGLAAAALSDSPVGIDAERVRTVDLRVAGKFAPPEREAVMRSREPYREFFRYWTAKEAYMKLTGRGLSAGLASFVLVPDADGFTISGEPDVKIYSLGGGGCISAVCTSGGDKPDAEYAAL